MKPIHWTDYWVFGTGVAFAASLGSELLLGIKAGLMPTTISLILSLFIAGLLDNRTNKR